MLSCGVPDGRFCQGGDAMKSANENQQPNSLSRLFTHGATGVAHATGKPLAFAACVLVVLIWAISGHYFRYSDTWQLVINTGTTIVTFLMVFLIQHTQNRDARALHLKLDELLRSMATARNKLID